MSGRLPTLIFQAYSNLTLSRQQGIGRLLGRLTYRFSSAYRNKFEAQLKAANLNNEAQIRWLAQQEIGAMFGEIPFVWTRTNQELLRLVEMCPQASAAIELARNEPTIFLTPHIGSFEVAGRLISHSVALTVLFKPAKQAWLTELMESARGHGQMKTAPANLSGVRQLLKALKAGESVGILPDQVPTDGDGQWAEFFGRPAYTMTLPSKLARNARHVWMVACERKPAAQGWRLRAWPVPLSATPAQINQVIEQVIREIPTQYLWAYNRYKAIPSARPATPVSSEESQ